jgi:NADH:ubiquinone oxidoreductase subunit 2 (subunit N)
MPIPTPALLPVDWWALGAVLALSAGTLLLLLLELVPGRSGGNRAAAVTVLTLVAGAAAVLKAGDARRALFGGMFVHDGFTLFFTLLFCAIALVRRAHLVGLREAPAPARRGVLHAAALRHARHGGDGGRRTT